MKDFNRLWLCLPRNLHAQHQLEVYKQRARFKFGPRQLDHETYICWRPPGSGEFTIRSPLRKYLQVQRSQYAGGNWTNAHGRVFANDFAILARFSDGQDRVPMASGSLKDFFLAGIRGLGTWGAGWFIDRRYNALSEHITQDDGAIQLLLEVTYQNEQILDVRIVSDEPESYFRKENNMRTIRARI